jgi:hypothetical protein
MERRRLARENSDPNDPNTPEPEPLYPEDDPDPRTFAFQLFANFDTGDVLSGAQSAFYGSVIDHRRNLAKDANKGKPASEKTATLENTPRPETDILNRSVSFAKLNDNTSRSGRDLILINPDGLVTVYFESNQGLILPPASNPATPDAQPAYVPAAVRQESTARAVANANGTSTTSSLYDVRNAGWGGMTTGMHQSSSPSVSLSDQFERTTLTALENGSVILSDIAEFSKDKPYVFKADIDGNGKDETITAYPLNTPVGRTDFATAVYNGASVRMDCDACYVIMNNEDVNGDGYRDLTAVTYKNEIINGEDIAVEKLRITTFKRPVAPDDHTSPGGGK